MSCGNGKCGKMSCGDCQYTYGPIASGFVLVPDNFNNVTNFLPKYPVYRSLQVQQKAVENTAFGKNCCEGNKDVSEYSTSCGGDGDMGFIMFPQRIRPVQVTVCGNITCVCNTKPSSGGDIYTGSCCGKKGSCAEIESHGYINWPPLTYVKDIRACGEINTKVCCRKHKRNDCAKCKVVAQCTKGCKKSNCGCN
jgi:hypothetical protein